MKGVVLNSSEVLSTLTRNTLRGVVPNASELSIVTPTREESPLR